MEEKRLLFTFEWNKGKYELIKQVAKREYISVGAWIRKAIDEKISRDVIKK